MVEVEAAGADIIKRLRRVSPQQSRKKRSADGSCLITVGNADPPNSLVGFFSESSCYNGRDPVQAL